MKKQKLTQHYCEHCGKLVHTERRTVKTPCVDIDYQLCGIKIRFKYIKCKKLLCLRRAIKFPYCDKHNRKLLDELMGTDKQIDPSSNLNHE